MSLSTRFFVGLEDEQEVNIYPQFFEGGRKRLLFLIALGLFVEISILLIVVIGHSTLAVWGGLVFIGAALFLMVLQLRWGPVLTINEQMLSLRPNPFHGRIDIQWEEIASLCVRGKSRSLSLDIILSPDHVEAFLLRQPPTMRKNLAQRLERTRRIPCFPRWLSIYYQPLPISLFYLIQKRYRGQIQQYHITLSDERT